MKRSAKRFTEVSGYVQCYCRYILLSCLQDPDHLKLQDYHRYKFLIQTHLQLFGHVASMGKKYVYFLVFADIKCQLVMVDCA